MNRCKTLEAIGVWNFFTPCGVFTIFSAACYYPP